ncbi:uncharacterized protein PHACADRAFT_103166, partial [Phanerochaete carnosa HHB-10118-sp]
PYIEKGYISLELQNCYFTLKKTAEDEKIALDKQIDLLSILQKEMPSYACCFRIFFVTKKFQISLVTHFPISSSTIQTGNMVNVQVAFSAAMVPENKYKMLLKLCSVYVIDRSVEKVGNEALYSVVCLSILRI